MKAHRKISQKEALQRAERLCSRMEKCTWDIRIKIKQWGLPDEEAENIIRQLKEKDFINDARYTSAAIRDKIFNNKWGKQKMIYFLKQKKINEQIISEGLHKIDETEYHRMVKEEIAKKFKQVSQPNKYLKKNKILHFGQSRGYEPALIMEIADEFFRE